MKNPLKNAAMKFKSLIFGVPFFLLLSGCTTTLYKPGATDADFMKDLTMAEMHADSVIRNSTLMPAQSGLESSARGLAIPMMRSRLIKDYMKTLGWEKESKGNRVSKTMKSPDPYIYGIGGLGALYDLHPKGFLVLNVATSGPANRAGLRAGDFITEIDGVDTIGMSRDDGEKRLKGVVGTRVALKLNRTGGDTENVIIVREDTSRLIYPR